MPSNTIYMYCRTGRVLQLASTRGGIAVTSGTSWCSRIIFLLGRLHLSHWKVEDLAYCYLYVHVTSHSSVWMYLMDKLSGRCTGRLQCNRRITQMHLLKLNGRVPRTSLGSSFWRDLLYTAARFPKKALGYILHGFLYERDCPVNDVGNGPHHLMDICYAFYITTLQHQYGTYRHRGVGGNCIMGETMAAA